MNSPFAVELFEKINIYFLSAFTIYVVKLPETRFSPADFLSLAAPVSSFFLFFFPQNGDLLGFIPGRSQQHLSNTPRAVDTD